jgi:hypothetical protein
MKKREKPNFMSKKTLDRLFEKRGRGRPGVRGSEIRGRADQYRTLLGHIWENIREPLLKAQTESDVIAAFPNPEDYYSRSFVPGYAEHILQIIRERGFPKRSKIQMNFLANSLAGAGTISARRSRDICAEERAGDVAPSSHQILRREFYVECSCGYKGPALDNACRKCGAMIPQLWGESL